MKGLEQLHSFFLLLTSSVSFSLCYSYFKSSALDLGQYLLVGLRTILIWVGDGSIGSKPSTLVSHSLLCFSFFKKLVDPFFLQSEFNPEYIEMRLSLHFQGGSLTPFLHSLSLLATRFPVLDELLPNVKPLEKKDIKLRLKLIELPFQS